MGKLPAGLMSRIMQKKKQSGGMPFAVGMGKGSMPEGDEMMMDEESESPFTQKKEGPMGEKGHKFPKAKIKITKKKKGKKNGFNFQ